ncbi:hypothetical protein K6V72_15830 [Ralstonia insidiosa]|uniref:Uncharacterized protein n=1 Tax=Ralstonia insidiosa TaxID=190721 RepID=A0A192A4N4_9RALS|nr:hypothetical protein [Ralstonia insidiosa]ANJ75440.1 hypothetical protein A9Y76_23370 [Ralstonia insidiosa]KAB0469768.1 hypothetical protein F7R11_21360 [Ralstonia insidiosa]MBY4910480.1 hypothetical protein [Ralstonia insidiosa]
MTLLDPRFWGGAILALALAFGLGYGMGDLHRMREERADALKRQLAADKTETRQAEATAQVADQAAQAQTHIQTVFRDRILYRDREVPHEVVVHDDAACRIPGRFVGMWNSANRAELPTTIGLLDEASSGVVLSDVEAQHEREAEAFHANAQQLKDLQDWVVRQAGIAKAQE